MSSATASTSSPASKEKKDKQEKVKTKKNDADNHDSDATPSSNGTTVAASTPAPAPARSSPAPAASATASASAPVAPLFDVSSDPSKVPVWDRIVVDAASFDKHASIPSCYKSLTYGPAPEESTALYAWLDEHGRKFGHFINNQWVKPEGRSYRPSYCPATLAELTKTIEGTAEDVDVAVKAARKAFGPWSSMSGHDRAKHLYSVARHLQKHHRLMAIVESMNNGKSIRETRDSDVPLVIRHFYSHAGWAQVRDEELPGWAPLGVIGEIVPWNFPLMLLAWKVCPALAMGNTVVLKPASYTRLSAILFAQICAEAGLPPGVFNLILGSGALGSTLADHPDVDKVAFTGSTPVGRKLRERIAGSGKKISLELGGKSPVIVFDTADIDSAVEGCVDAIWFNQGQVCCAGSRLILQESIHDRFVQKLKRRMDTFRVGHPLDKAIDMGALVDESQFKTIKGFVDQARQEGGEVYVARTPVPNNGWYWPPTLITKVSPVSTCVREEIFGPVLTVLKFRSPEEAIDLANNTFFGLAGSVWTENISLAMEVACSIKAGCIWINSHNLFDAAAGFGGYRESGFGRDGGKEGLFEYVKPSWKPRAHCSLKMPTEKISWRSLVMPRPASVEASSKALALLGSSSGAPRIDKTHKNYIGGAQKRPDQAYCRTILDAQTGAALAQVGEGNRKDIRDAVEAAHKAAPGWGKRAAHNRAQICFYIAENLAERFEEFAKRIHVQTGRPMDSCEKEVRLSIERLFYYAAYADKFGGTVQETTLYGLTVAIHEPIGVLGIACPDEYPLLGFISLVAPAVVRSNTVVVIPSEKYPLSAVDLYEVLETSDLPGGVINIVTGDRDFLTRTLCEHQDVDAMWYFGTEEGSQNVEYSASENMKRTFVGYGYDRNWEDPAQGQGMEFLREAVQVKNIWAPMGECKGTGGGY